MRRYPAQHRTADGRVVSIGCMTDDHLLNTIKLHLRPIEAATKKLNDPQQARSVRAIALYGDSYEKLVNNYGDMIDKAYKKVGPYILEAVLRGESLTSEVRTYLQTAFGRSQMDMEGPSLLLTNDFVEGNEHDD